MFFGCSIICKKKKMREIDIYFIIFTFLLQDVLISQEQLLRELDMYQEIAVAKGPEYDRLNQKMDKCQENIESLSDEIQRLQGT